MKNKLIFAAGLATGYVLGSRAGRSSYEELKTKAQELWNNPKVQETVSDATETIKAKAPEVQAQAGHAVKKAQETLSGALHRNDDSEDTQANNPTDQYKI